MEQRDEQLAHLRGLATELNGHQLAVEIVDQEGRPQLKVANESVPELNERVLCEQTEDGTWCFVWAWYQPIGAVNDLTAVVDKIATVLRSVERAT